MSVKNANNRRSNLHILNAALLCAVATGFSLPSYSAERSFSFRDAEYHFEGDDALPAAKAFIASQLPAGLSEAEAVARLSRAGLDCGRPKPSGTLTCSIGSMADTWSVRLTLDGRRDVSKASVDYELIQWANN